MMNCFILSSKAPCEEAEQMFSSPAVTLMLLHVMVQFIFRMSFYELCDDVMIDDMQNHSWIQQITLIAVRLLQDLTVKSVHLTSFTDCAADWLMPAEALWTNHVLFPKQPVRCSVRIKAVALNLSRLGLITGNRSKTVLWRSLALKEVMFLFFYIKFSRRDPHWHIFFMSENLTLTVRSQKPSIWVTPYETGHICYALLWWPLSQICITLSKFRHTNMWFSSGDDWVFCEMLHRTSGPLCTFSLWKVCHAVRSLQVMKLKRMTLHCRCIKPPVGRGIRVPCTSGWDVMTKRSNKMGMRTGSWEYDALKLPSWGVSYKVESV